MSDYRLYYYRSSRKSYAYNIIKYLNVNVDSTQIFIIHRSSNSAQHVLHPHPSPLYLKKSKGLSGSLRGKEYSREQVQSYHFGPGTQNASQARRRSWARGSIRSRGGCRTRVGTVRESVEGLSSATQWFPNEIMGFKQSEKKAAKILCLLLQRPPKCSNIWS